MVNSAIVGTGEVPIERNTERSLREQTIEIAYRGIRNAGLESDDIDVVLAANVFGDPGFTSDLVFSWLVEELGISDCKMNMLAHAGGATGENMLTVADSLIEAGEAENVLCLHTEMFSLMSQEDQVRAFASFGISDEWEIHTGITYPAIAGLHAQRYLETTDSTPEDLAAVVESCREWGMRHPNALYNEEPITIEEIVESPMIASPLTMYMCNVLADGGSSFVVSSKETAEELTDRPAYVLGHGSANTHYSVAHPPGLYTGGRERWQRAGERVFESAGIGRDDIDLANIYVAFPPGHLEALEALDFCEFGQAGEFIRSGETKPGGSLPMCTNGGALSHGHLGAGVGPAMLVETAKQVMHRAEGDRQVEDARFALQTGSGGSGMDVQLSILGGEIP